MSEVPLYHSAQPPPPHRPGLGCGSLEQVLHRHVQRFRGWLEFKVHRLLVSLNSSLESNKEEEDLRDFMTRTMAACPAPLTLNVLCRKSGEDRAGREARGEVTSRNSHEADLLDFMTRTMAASICGFRSSFILFREACLEGSQLTPKS